MIFVIPRHHPWKPNTQHTKTKQATTQEKNGRTMGDPVKIISANQADSTRWRIKLRPHNRHDCLQCQFVPDGTTPHDRDVNSQFCELCHCYICDRPASECQNWYLGKSADECIIKDSTMTKDGEQQPKSEPIWSDTENPAAAFKKMHGNHDEYTPPFQNHSQATTKGRKKRIWIAMRNAIKQGRDPCTVREANLKDSEYQTLYVQKHVRLLEHSKSCNLTKCTLNCTKMKTFIHHPKICKVSCGILLAEKV